MSTVIKPATELKPGEYFIWATDRARKIVCANIDPECLQVLRVEAAEMGPGHDGHIEYSLLDGSQGWRSVTRTVLVAVIDRASGAINGRVKCLNCGKDAGYHYPGLDARTTGFECHRNGSGEWFVPEETSFRKYHKFPDAKAQDDYFASLGL